MCKKLIYLVSLVLVLGFTVTSAAHPSPVAWWKLDGDVLDSSGNDRNGTINGNPTFVPGVFGQALEFHGNPDYVTIDGYKGIVTDGTNCTCQANIGPLQNSRITNESVLERRCTGSCQ